MSYLKTKAQFDALNSLQKRCIANDISELHRTHIWVSIDLDFIDSRADSSWTKCTFGMTSRDMSNCVKTNYSVVDFYIEVTQVKSWLV